MNRVAVSSVPMYQQGWASASPRRRYAHLAAAPAIPLHQLGWLGDGAKVLASTAPIASTAAGMVAAHISAISSFAGPIGVGVGVLVGVIAGLWAKHEARVKGAKAENQAINSAVSTWDAGMKAIFDAANSSDPAVNVPGPAAAQYVTQLYQQFWAQMIPFTKAPGAADTSGGGMNCGSSQLNPAGPCAGTPGGHKCDKSCTAACCVGCQDLYPSMLQAVAVLNSPSGGTVQVCTVVGSKYGAIQRGTYTLTYKPPVLPTIGSEASSLLSEVTNALTGGSGASGTPGTSGNNTGFLLALAALAAVVLL